ncbi:MAG: D-alanine--D-alanine ligase [Chloroflexi bacterium]|nr:MAG: D-alanine--D-alanine ligase [Phototrophicales bacterium]RMF81319.1 MAG: D-alanine--D-alanine ligase [Chloroflexota bacterium]
MSSNRKTVVGVIFGGRSVEHDVSVVTGNQVMRAFDTDRYEVVPIYIDRNGKWFTGKPLMELKNFNDEVTGLPGVEDAILSPSINHHGLIINPIAGRFSKSAIKRLDVVFPAVHGTHGEDGTLQGLLELADIPYVGCGVMASAIANDKIMTKAVLQQSGIPVVDSVHFSRIAWRDDPDAIIKQLEASLTYPMFIKPATTGSSIGIGYAPDETLLRASIDIATHFDRNILVEGAVADSVEINCAVMGNDDDIRASVLEQPVSWQDFLTYEEKYLRGNEGMKSADRIIPAPLTDELTEQIRQTAIDSFKAIDGRGTARVDLLVKPDENVFYVNEINTMPGSLAFYLWQEEGLSSAETVEQLVQLAQDAHAIKRQSTYNYQTNLIAQTAARGLKGAKGRKSVTN